MFRTYRGGDLPNDPAVREFFAPGKVYRTREYVSSSGSVSMAMVYMRNAASVDGLEPTLWTFEFGLERVVEDRSRTLGNVKCLHVNHIDESMTDLTVENEDEYLLPPYSVLEVRKVTISADPSKLKPHKITLAVRNNNKMRRPGVPWSDLPLAPWS